MAGGFRIEVQLPSGARRASHARAKKPVFAHGGVTIWSDEPVVPVDQQSIIIGHLFSRGSPSQRVTKLKADGEGLASNCGRSLLGDYWGGYIFVRVDGNGVVQILRDPSGLLPCYARTEADRIVLAGDMAEVASRGRDVVDFEEIARTLASADARGRKTCIAGVEELIAGECLMVDGDRIWIEPWWSPWHHVKQPPGMSFDDAAARLREVVADCVGAWASCFSSILLGLSGGLDSSIVAAAAAARAERLTCMTLFGPDFDGDERRYAAATANALGLELREAMRDVRDIDIDRAAAPHHPWPVAALAKQTNEAVHRRLESELSIDAHFTGNGGDGILCGIRSAVPLLDRLLSEGPRSGLGTTLRDICLLTGADRMTVVRHAWKRFRCDRGRHVARFDLVGLHRDVLARIEAAGPSHPWLVPPDGILPGKTVHAAYLMRSQKGIELYPRAVRPLHIAPLQSQPIVELCLSIPTWMWVADGLNRAVARRAFEGGLPPAILARTQKGGPGGFDLQVYRRYRAALHAHLRGGLLERAGIFDAALLDIAEDPSWRGTARIQRILDFASAESWARWWSAAS
ncbi:Asparagine synthase [Novosphingobium resinovorum]|uniref:asparagine synthase (glutamine-hydrolyzing) n=1 Tax=Novosphingobium resinovorum TaxID=158500 RepID=A0A031K412_9SPHN|nr:MULTISPECIES: asparagine synthase C-terminal domain-containing protein [Novosphingobium]EZP83985.1 Asparagine synthase [Novosphingobium resinovorum]